jgi:hypothetical protein
LYFFELHFIFYQFLKFIPTFGNIKKNKKSKNPPHSAGSASAHGSGTAGLAHNHFGLAGMSSPAVETGRGLLVENRCGEGMTSGTVVGNGAHRERVVDGEVARWRRGGGAPMAGSSHGGRRWLGVFL